MNGKIQVKVKPVSPLIGAKIELPAYATPGSAGMDLRACIDRPLSLAPGERTLIPTGIAIQLPSPHIGAFIFARSGLASKHGIHLANGVGVVDSDYTGEIKCALMNSSDETFTIAPGDRIAQLVFLPVYIAELTIVDALEKTVRGAGGFGHTGV